MNKYGLAKLLFVGLILSFGLSAFSQDCSGVSSKKDKQELSQTFSGIASSNEFYSVLISKKISRSGKSLPVSYNIFLNVATKVLFSDSELQTTGTFTFITADTSIVFDRVVPSNNPLGFCCTLGFTLELSEEQFNKLKGQTIFGIRAFNKVQANFSDKKQRKLQNLLNCLISKI